MELWIVILTITMCFVGISVYKTGQELFQTSIVLPEDVLKMYDKMEIYEKNEKLILGKIYGNNVNEDLDKIKELFCNEIFILEYSNILTDDLIRKGFNGYYTDNFFNSDNWINYCFSIYTIIKNANGDLHVQRSEQQKRKEIMPKELTKISFVETINWSFRHEFDIKISDSCSISNREYKGNSCGECLSQYKEYEEYNGFCYLEVSINKCKNMGLLYDYSNDECSSKYDSSTKIGCSNLKGTMCDGNCCLDGDVCYEDNCKSIKEMEEYCKEKPNEEYNKTENKCVCKGGIKRDGNNVCMLYIDEPQRCANFGYGYYNDEKCVKCSELNRLDDTEVAGYCGGCLNGYTENDENNCVSCSSLNRGDSLEAGLCSDCKEGFTEVNDGCVNINSEDWCSYLKRTMCNGICCPENKYCYKEECKSSKEICPENNEKYDDESKQCVCDGDIIRESVENGRCVISKDTCTTDNEIFSNNVCLSCSTLNRNEANEGDTRKCGDCIDESYGYTPELGSENCVSCSSLFRKNGDGIDCGDCIDSYIKNKNGDCVFCAGVVRDEKCWPNNEKQCLSKGLTWCGNYGECRGKWSICLFK